MKTIYKKISVAALALTLAGSANAQLSSGYFAEGYLYRHEMNPAIGNDKGYIAMPALGNFNLGVNGSLGLSDVLYNVNGKTTTFMNPAVSTSEFLSHIKDNNKFTNNVRLQILGFGFRGMGGYNTFEVNYRHDIGVRVPGTLFRMMKEGLSNQTYDVTNFGAHAQAYAELAIGHSHQVNDALRVGAKLKVLVGAGNIDARFDKAQLSLAEDGYSAVTNATIDASVKGLTFEEETTMRGPEGHQTQHKYVNGVDIDSPGINGFGLGVDLGAEMFVTDDMKVSAAIVDLGFINWNNNTQASTNGDRIFTTSGYTFSANDDANNSFENEMDRMSEDLAALYELKNNGNTGSRTTGLGATLNLGVEYYMPFYDKLSVSALCSNRFAGKYSYTDCRVGANLAPAKFFSVAANVSAGTYGVGFGWMLSLHPKGFGLYMGMDRILGSLAKQGIPLNSNAQFSMGLNFPF